MSSRPTKVASSLPATNKRLRELRLDELENVSGGDGWFWGSNTPDNACVDNGNGDGECPAMTPNDPNTACDGDSGMCFQGFDGGDGY